jgi:hypothetical protein
MIQIIFKLPLSDNLTRMDILILTATCKAWTLWTVGQSDSHFDTENGLQRFTNRVGTWYAAGGGLFATLSITY